MGLSTFNRNRERAAEQARHAMAPPTAPRPTTEQNLRAENESLRAELAAARSRIATLEREVESLTAPPEPKPEQPSGAGRGRR